MRYQEPIASNDREDPCQSSDLSLFERRLLQKPTKLKTDPKDLLVGREWSRWSRIGSHKSQQARSTRELNQRSTNHQETQNQQIESKNNKRVISRNLAWIDSWLLLVYSHSIKEDKALIKSTQSILSRTLTSTPSQNKLGFTQIAKGSRGCSHLPLLFIVEA